MTVSAWAGLSWAGGRPPLPLSPGDLEGRGRIVGFLSPAPGAGAATLACLAALAAAGEGTDVALADLEPRGKVRSYMGLTPDVCPASVLDVAGIEAPEEVGRAGALHPRKVFVVPGAPRALDAPQVTTQLALKTLALLKRAFTLTVAVLGPLYAAGWAAAMACDRLWLVVRPLRLDLDFFADDMDLLARLGCAPRIGVALNQDGLPGGLRSEEAAEAFGASVVVPHLPQLAAGCNRRYLEAPKKLRKQLLDMLRFGA